MEMSIAQIYNYYKMEFIKDCLNEFDQLSDADKVRAAVALNFKSLYLNNASRIPYNDPWVSYLYFMRYGVAYGFEYAMLYEMMLRNFDGNAFKVVSLGCGSCLDAWAIAYARKRIGQDNIAIEYWGYDIEPWDVSVFNNVEEDFLNINHTYNNNNYSISNFTVHKPLVQDLCQEIPDDRTHPNSLNNKDFNVLILPKVLLDLGQAGANTLVESLKRVELDRNKTYYLCVSHSKSDVIDEDENVPDYSVGIPFVNRVIREVFERQGFRASDDFQTVQSLSDHFDLPGENTSFEIRNGCCFIAPETARINALNDDFKYTSIRSDNGNIILDNYIRSEVIPLINDDNILYPLLSDESLTRLQNKKNRDPQMTNDDAVHTLMITTAKYIAFQIIKFEHP